MEANDFSADMRRTEARLYVLFHFNSIQLDTNLLCCKTADLVARRVVNWLLKRCSADIQ